MDFRYQRHFKAPRGEHGMSKNQHGRGAKDMIVKVPPGTVVSDEKTNEVIADLIEHGQRAVIAKGGRGGRGNIVLLHLPILLQSFQKMASQVRKEISCLN